MKVVETGVTLTVAMSIVVMLEVGGGENYGQSDDYEKSIVTILQEDDDIYSDGDGDGNRSVTRGREMYTRMTLKVR